MDPITLALMGMSVFSSISGGINASDAAKAQGQAQYRQNMFNASLSDAQAVDASKRGDVNLIAGGRAASAAMGSQKASAAAQGIDVGSGSAAGIQADTVKMSALDMATIRNNSAREAFGYQQQAENYRNAGTNAAQAGQNTANSSLLTGGLNALTGAGNIYGNYINNKGKTGGGQD